MLVGHLKSKGYSTRTVDLNIKVANQFCEKITEDEAVDASSIGTLEALNQPFYKRQNTLTEIAKNYDGTWPIKYGFQFNEIDPARPQHVFDAARREAPYTAFIRRFLDRLTQEQLPDLFGITVTVPTQLVAAFHIAEILKDLQVDVPLIMGGNIPTRLLAEMKIESVFDFFDGYVGFGGELAIEEIMMLLERGYDWKTASNLVTLRDDKIVQNPTKHPKKGEFAWASFDGIHSADYWGAKYLPTVASRGCYYGKCSFCAIPYAWGPNGFLGNDDPVTVASRLIEDSHVLSNTRWKFIEESLHPSIVRNISKQFVNSGAGLEWEGYARLDRPWVDSDLLKQAARSGLRKLYVGLEIIPGKGRDLLNKNDNVDIMEFLRACQDNGVKVHLFTMIGSPGSSHVEAFDTIEFLLENDHLIDTVDCSAFEYAKHTKMIGVERIEDERIWALASPYKTTDPTFMSEDEVEALGSKMEEVLYKAKPKWLHPIYRMVTPWR